MNEDESFEFQFSKQEIITAACIAVLLCCCWTVTVWLFAGGTCCRTKQFVTLQNVESIPLTERLALSDDASDCSVEDVISLANIG